MIGGSHDSGIKKSNTINRRMFIFAAAKAVVFFGIVGRLFSLQISENKKYLTLSDKNRLREARLPPIRGEFVDYFGNRIAKNLTVYQLHVIPEQVEDFKTLMVRLKDILNLSNKLKFIDIGVPRNISNDVKQHQFVKSFDVDDLQEVVSRNQEFRQKIAKEAESLVEEERIIFLEWWASLEAVPVINKLRSDLELIRKEELQKALSRMGPDFSARERKVVEALTKGIINKILHTPVTKLRSPQSREERQVSLKIVEKLFSLVEEDKNN